MFSPGQYDDQRGWARPFWGYHWRRKVERFRLVNKFKWWPKYAHPTQH